MKQKILQWIKRYGLAEILAVIGALVGAFVINFLFRKPVLTALGGTWGENLFYYGTIVSNDLYKLYQKHGRISFISFMKTVRNLVVEFGPGEYLDSLLVRPFAMYFFPKLLNSLPLGIIVGKFAADFIFYIPTIIAFELRKKVFTD